MKGNPVYISKNSTWSPRELRAAISISPPKKNLLLNSETKSFYIAASYNLKIKI
jgi:hypothetical protein